MLKKHGITDPGKVVTTPLTVGFFDGKDGLQQDARLLKVVSYLDLSLIHISEPTRLGMISYAVFCLKKKKNKKN